VTPCPKCGAETAPDGKAHSRFPSVARCRACGTRTSEYEGGERMIWRNDGHVEVQPADTLATDQGREEP
jgi:ribosomal protein S27E